MVASFEEWLWARHSHAITFWFSLSLISGVLISVKMPKHPSCLLQAFMSVVCFCSFMWILCRAKPYERAYIPMSIANVSVMLITLSLAMSEEIPGANLYFLANSWTDTLSIITALVPTLLFGRFGKFWAVLAVLHTIPMIPYYKRMVGYNSLQALGRAIFIHAACYGVYYLLNAYELRAYSKYCSSNSGHRQRPLKSPTGSDRTEGTQSTQSMDEGKGKVAEGEAECSASAAQATRKCQPQQSPPPREHAAAIRCDAIASSKGASHQGLAAKEGLHAHTEDMTENLEHARPPVSFRQYRSKTRTTQVAVKISGPISPEDFPPGAADDLMSMLNASFPPARASQPAVRWGCVLLALDIVGAGGPTKDLNQEQLESQVSDTILQWAAKHRLQGPLALQVGNRMLQWGPCTSGRSDAQWELREVVPLDADGCSIELPAEVLCLLPETPSSSSSAAAAAAAAEEVTTGAGDLQQQEQQQQQQQQQAPVRVQMRAIVAVPSSSVLVAWQGSSTKPEANHVLLLARTQGHFLPVEFVKQQPGGGPCAQTQHELELAVPLPLELLPRSGTPELLWMELWQGNTALLTSSLAILWPPSHEHTVAELAQVFREPCAEREEEVRSFAADVAMWLQDRRLPDRATCVAESSVHACDRQTQQKCSSAEAKASGGAGESQKQPPPEPKPPQQQQQEQQQQGQDLKHQHQTPKAVTLGYELLHAAILFGLPTLSDVVLQGLMQPPLSRSFADVARSCCALFPEGESTTPAASSAGLLSLALQSHSAGMVLKVLEWGRTHAHPFSWEALDAELGMSGAQLLGHLPTHDTMLTQLLPAVEGEPVVMCELSAVRKRSARSHEHDTEGGAGEQQEGAHTREGACVKSGSANECTSVGGTKEGEDAAACSDGCEQRSVGVRARRPNLWLCSLVGFGGPGASPSGWTCEREYRDYNFKAVCGLLTPTASVCLLMMAASTLKVCMFSQYSAELVNWQSCCSVLDGLLLLGMLLGRRFHTRMAFLVMGRVCYLAQLFAMGMSWLPMLPFARIMALTRADVGVDALMYNVIYNMSTPFSMEQGFPWPLAFDFLVSTAANASLFRAVGLQFPVLQSIACRCFSVLLVFCLDVRNRRAFHAAHEQRVIKKE